MNLRQARNFKKAELQTATSHWFNLSVLHDNPEGVKYWSTKIKVLRHEISQLDKSIF